MSIFSIYTGLIYNEAFAIPLSVFGSGHWACPTNAAVGVLFKLTALYSMVVLLAFWVACKQVTVGKMTFHAHVRVLTFCCACTRSRTG